MRNQGVAVVGKNADLIRQVIGHSRYTAFSWEINNIHGEEEVEQPGSS